MIISVEIGVALYLAIFYTVSGSVTIEQPTNHLDYVENSGAISLNCIASCTNSTCRYAWTSSDVNLTGTLTSNTLSIPELQRKTGIYTIHCRVTNVGYGTTGTCTRTVDVLYPPKVTVVEDNNSLVCKASGNPQHYIFKGWEHSINDVPIRSLPGSISLIVSTDYQNRGTYECRVTNNVTAEQTGSLEITRNAIPMILTKSHIEQNVSKWDVFHTLIEIYAYPEILEITLYKTDTSTDDSLSYINKTESKTPLAVQFYQKQVFVTGTRLELHIDEMKEDYFGEYDVLVTNSAGNTTAKVVLTPKGPPDIPFDFTINEIDPNYVLFQLTSGFHNGANQTVVIQYRPDINGSVWHNGSMEDVGREQNRTVVLRVDGLTPLTSYVFQAYSYNRFNKSLVVEIYATTREEPMNLALIGGAIGGVVVGLILVGVVVVILVVRRKRRRRKEAPRMLPKLSIPNIFDNNRTKDHTPPPVNSDTTTPDIYENTNSTSALFKNTDNELYENTQVNNCLNTEIVRKESNYANTPLFVGASFKNNKGENRKQEEPVIYSNTNGMLGIEEAKTTATEAKESGDEPDRLGYKEQNSQKSNEGQDEYYLDMEVCTPNSTHTPERTYSNRQAFGQAFSTKNKSMKIVQKQMSESSELYMDMDEERRDSVPDYQAPLPPPPLPHQDPTGDDYVNLRKKGKRPF